MNADRGFRRRASSRRGMALVWFLLVGAAALAVVSLFVDFRLVFYTRSRVETCAEESAHRALSEFWMPDYTAATFALAGNPPNWAPRFREDPTRAAARAMGLQYTIGPAMNYAPYAGDIQLNSANAAAGDIILGNWTRSGGGAYSFTPVAGAIAGNGDIPNAVRVVVRRTRSSQVAGVSDGDNAIPHVLGWGWSGPAGLQTRSQVTVVNTPAAIVGPGGTVTLADGSTTRTGVMPLALILRPAVATWLASGTIGATIQVDIDSTPTGLAGGAEAFFTDHNMAGATFTNSRNMLRYLRNLGGAQTPPPRVRLNDLPSRVNLSGGNTTTLMNLLSGSFNNRTWVVPVIANNNGATPAGSRLRVIGFAHVRCTAVNVGARRLTLARAPSGVTRNAGGLNSCLLSFGGAIPANVAAGGDIRNRWIANFWTVVGGQQVSSRPWGVASTGTTVGYRP